MTLPMCAILLLAGIIYSAQGHGYLSSPRGRNIVAYQDGLDSSSQSGATASTPLKDWCSHCVNRAGICGAADSSNLGYDYNNPKSVLGNILPFTIQDVYNQGSIIDVDYILTTHHKGHIEMKACPIPDDRSVPHQSCFDSFPLLFLQDETYPIMTPDNNFRARSYVYQGNAQQYGSDPSGTRFSLKYKLPPNLNGDRILLQWHYVTANTCFDIGYGMYSFPFAYPSLNDCQQPLPTDGAVGGAYKPEQFWNCAEIRIIPFPGAPPTPIPEPLPEDWRTAPTPPTVAVTNAPTSSPRNRCGASWTDAVDSCRPEQCSSNVDCDNGQYCYSSVSCDDGSGPKSEIFGSEWFFCGSDRIAAMESCGVNCPNGLDSDCPPGEFCFRQLFECAADPDNFCGPTFEAASEQCSLPCPNGSDDECPENQSCFDGVTTCGPSYIQPGTPTTSYPTPFIEPTAPTPITTANYCGNSWMEANTLCSSSCPGGKDSECPVGQSCFGDIHSCGSGGSDENFCGLSWIHADSTCSKACPQGLDSECPSGYSCFSDCTSCPGNNNPTAPPPSPPSPTVAMTGLPIAPYATGSCDSTQKMKVNLGYYQSWAVWRNNCYIVEPEDIDIEGMGYTHLVYAFASVSPQLTIEAWNGVVEEEIPRMLRMNALKQQHPGLKTLIGIGGWTHNGLGTVFCRRFSDVSATAARREIFAKSVIDFLRTHNFDGIDFDWEYPVDPDRCGVPEDKENYALLVQAMRQAIFNSPDDYLITMAVPVSATRLDQGYDLSSLSQNLDYINIMTYDIYGYWSEEVGSHSDMRHIRDVVSYVLSQGVPSEQLIMGLGAYGRTFSLSDTSCTDIGCPFNGARGGGCPVWNEKGYTAYVTIKEIIASQSYKKLSFNPVTESMELVTNDYEFISFDNEQTFTIKAAYASEQCMGGYMWWAVDMVGESFGIEVGSPTTSPVPTSVFSPSDSPTRALNPPTNDPEPADPDSWHDNYLCAKYHYPTSDLWQTLVEQEGDSTAVIPAEDTWNEDVVNEWEVNGNPEDDEAGELSGKVKVYESGKLFQTFFGTAGDFFGKGVALSVDTLTLLVSSSSANRARGKVFVYHRSTTVNQFTIKQFLTKNEEEQHNYFGTTIAMTPNGLAVAVTALAYYIDDETTPGSVFLYLRESRNNFFTRVGRGDGCGNEFMGYEGVAIEASDDVLLVHAKGEANGGCNINANRIRTYRLE